MDCTGIKISAIKLENQDETSFSSADEDIKPETILVVHDDTNSLVNESCRISLKPTSNPTTEINEIDTHVGQILDCPAADEDFAKAKTKKRFQCTQCVKSFTRKFDLKIHTANFHADEKDKPYQCEICLGEKVCQNCMYEKSLIEHKAKQKKKAEECKDMESHKCDICSKEFGTLSKLVGHVHTVHVVDKPFECQYCSKTFMREKQLAWHVKFHEDKIQFQCDLCPSRFAYKNNLTRHLKYKHQRFFYCPKCLESFDMKSDLYQHLNTVSKIDTKIRFYPKFKCEMCQKSFQSQCSLNVHTNSHLNLNLKSIKTESKEEQTRDEFQCDMCSKTFDSSLNLVWHKKNVHPNSEWQCKICLKLFRKRHVMVKHQKLVHSTEQSYKCDVCNSTFKFQSSLNKHRYTHFEEKRWKCQVCDKSFSQYISLKVHTSNFHSGEKPFKCYLCSKSWALNSQLQDHVISHTSQKLFDCDLCSRSFKRAKALDAHYQRAHQISKSNKSVDSVHPSKPKYYSNVTVTVFTCRICSFKTEDEKDVAIHYYQHGFPKVKLSQLVLCKSEDFTNCINS